MKINNVTFIEANEKRDNSFVGIRIADNKIEFHYPETYVLSNTDEGLRRDILAILRTLYLARTKTKENSSLYSENKNYDLPLQSFLWIINDYLTYGKYPNIEKIYEKGTKGKINWKKTLDSDPVISNGNVIYTDFISERRDQRENILTEIYDCCVNQAIDAIGWIYNLTFDKFDKNYNELFKKKHKLYLSVINTELSHTYEDKKRTRLQNMKNIITGLDENIISTKEVLYGVDSYDGVYEKMVDSMFSNIDDISKFYPTTDWHLELEDGKPFNPSSLRPDTIIEKNNNLYILDSKYYRYGTTFSKLDVPKSDSIQKQITYGEYVRRVIEGKYDNIYSAFIMPYSKTSNRLNEKYNENIEFVGTATAKWYESNEESNRRIVGLLLDTNYLINNWVKKNEDNINDIVSKIEDNYLYE